MSPRWTAGAAARANAWALLAALPLSAGCYASAQPAPVEYTARVQVTAAAPGAQHEGDYADDPGARSRGADHRRAREPLPDVPAVREAARADTDTDTDTDTDADTGVGADTDGDTGVGAAPRRGVLSDRVISLGYGPASTCANGEVPPPARLGAGCVCTCGGCESCVPAPRRVDWWGGATGATGSSARWSPAPWRYRRR